MQDSNWEDYYQILGVDSEAGLEQIRRAYRALVMDYHPDRQTGATDAVRRLAEDKLKEINRAYEVLSDPQKRRRYHAGWFPRNSPTRPAPAPASDSWVSPRPAASSPAGGASSAGMGSTPATGTHWYHDPSRWATFKRKAVILLGICFITGVLASIGFEMATDWDQLFISGG